MILREIIAHFGVTADDTQLTKLDSTIDKVKQGLLALGSALGVAKLVEFTNQAAETADNIGDVAERLNISTDSLQAWGHAAKLSGSSSEEFEGSISHLVRSLSEVGAGNEDAIKAFRALGVSAKDSDGHLRRVDDLLPEIADGLANVANPTERSALAMKVFGRGAIGLVPLLSKGSAGIAKLREEFEALGGGYSEQAIQQSSDYNDQLDRLVKVVDSLKSKALNVLLPVFTRVAEALTRAGQAFAWVAEKTQILESAMVVIGARAAWLAGEWVVANHAILLSTIKTWGLVALKFGVVAAGLAVIIAAVEDVLVLFSGGKSVIGEFIDSIAGAGAAEEAVISIKQGWDELVYSIQNAIHASKEFLGLDAGAAPKDPEQVREERRNAAVASGDVNAFAREHAAGRTREQSVEDFKASRAHYLKDHPEAATDKDVTAGLATKAAAATAPPAVSVKAQRQAAGKSVSIGDTHVNITVPHGTSPELAAEIERRLEDVIDRHHGRTVAELGQEGSR